MSRPRTSHAGRAPAVPWSGSVATFASQGPRHDDVDSGIANGGGIAPAPSPAEPGPSVVTALNVTHAGQRDQEHRQEDARAPHTATARLAGRCDSRALRDDQRGREDGEHAEQRDREVDDRDEAEVAQHRDVGGDQDREAGDRGDAGGQHGGAGRAVGPLERLARLEAGRALLAVAGAQQHRELGRDRDHERAERGRHRVQRHAHEPQHERRPARGQRDRDERHPRARPRAVDGEQGERHRRQARQRRQEPPQRVAERVVGVGGEDGQPGQRGADARAAGRAASACPASPPAAPPATAAGCRRRAPRCAGRA